MRKLLIFVLILFASDIRSLYKNSYSVGRRFSSYPGSICYHCYNACILNEILKKMNDSALTLRDTVPVFILRKQEFCILGLINNKIDLTKTKLTLHEHRREKTRYFC